MYIECGVDMDNFGKITNRAEKLNPCIRLMLFGEIMKSKDPDYLHFFRLKIFDASDYIEQNKKFPFICEEIVQSLIGELIDRGVMAGVSIKFSPEDFDFNDWNSICFLTKDPDSLVAKDI